MRLSSYEIVQCSAVVCVQRVVSLYAASYRKTAHFPKQLLKDAEGVREMNRDNRLGERARARARVRALVASHGPSDGARIT